MATPGRKGSSSQAASPHEPLRYQFHAKVIEASEMTDTAQRTATAVPLGHTVRFAIVLMGEDGQSKSLNHSTGNLHHSTTSADKNAADAEGNHDPDANASTTQIQALYLGKVRKADVERLSHVADGTLFSFDAAFYQSVGVRCWLYNYVREEMVTVSTLAIVEPSNTHLQLTLRYEDAILPVKLSWFLQQQQRNGEMVIVSIPPPRDEQQEQQAKANARPSSGTTSDHPPRSDSPNPDEPAEANQQQQQQEEEDDDEAKAKRLFFHTVSERQKSTSKAHDDDDDAYRYDDNGPVGAVNFDKEAKRRKKMALTLSHGNQDWRSNKLYLSGGAYAHWAPSEKAVHKVVLAERGLTDDYMLNRLAWTDGRVKTTKAGAHSPLRDAATRMLSTIYFPVVHKNQPAAGGSGGSPQRGRPGSNRSNNNRAKTSHSPTRTQKKGKPLHPSANSNPGGPETEDPRVKDEERDEAEGGAEGGAAAAGGTEGEGPQSSSKKNSPAHHDSNHTPRNPSAPSAAKPAATATSSRNHNTAAGRTGPSASSSVQPYLMPLSPRSTKARPPPQIQVNAAASMSLSATAGGGSTSSAGASGRRPEEEEGGDEEERAAQGTKSGDGEEPASTTCPPLPSSATKKQQPAPPPTSSSAKAVGLKPAKPKLAPITHGSSRQSASRGSAQRPPADTKKEESAQMLDKLFV
jgi:hypothetical protein